jgi:hypothetical protein
MQLVSAAKRLASVALLTFLPWSATATMAADIQVLPSSSDEAFVVIRGELFEGDEFEFRGKLLPFRAAAILFESPGGNLLAGLEIGRTIRDSGYFTAVAPGTRCSSACALAWLGGIERTMAPSAEVGFHAAYVREGRMVRESGMGNALVGAYLAGLGLDDRAIAYLTVAPPDSMLFLDPEMLSALGIPVSVLSDDAQQMNRRPSVSALPPIIQPSTSWLETPIPGQQLHLPSHQRWIVVRSGPEITRAELDRYATLRDILGEGTTRVVRTQNGMTAIVVGPLATRNAQTAMDTLKAGRWIPEDSYLSSGARFVTELR